MPRLDLARLDLARLDLQRALGAHVRDEQRPQVGPFVVLFDETSDSPYRNYAAPFRGDPPTPTELAQLVQLFHQRGRRPRVEYVETPALSAQLVSAGFSVTRRLPLLLLGLSGVIEPALVEGITVRSADGTDDLIGAAAVQVLAYSDTEPVQRAAERLADTLRGGGSVAVALDSSGRIVGAALHTAPQNGFAEVAAVAVDDAHRRRGIGAAVSAEASRLAIARGAHPFLQAEGEDEARMYQRIGFERVGALVLADGPALDGG